VGELLDCALQMTRANSKGLATGNSIVVVIISAIAIVIVILIVIVIIIAIVILIVILIVIVIIIANRMIRCRHPSFLSRVEKMLHYSCLCGCNRSQRNDLMMELVWPQKIHSLQEGREALREAAAICSAVRSTSVWASKRRLILRPCFPVVQLASQPVGVQTTANENGEQISAKHTTSSLLAPDLQQTRLATQ
jgi:hypothetical protein